MAVILDTTAVVGLLELTLDRALIGEAIRRHSRPADLPRLHLVSLGELRAGVEHASLSKNRRAVTTRQRTLAAAKSDRFRQVTIEESDWDWFGIITGRMGRKPTHNDKWIVAAALSRDLTLITQDEQQADRALSLPNPPSVDLVPRRS